MSTLRICSIIPKNFVRNGSLIASSKYQARYPISNYANHRYHSFRKFSNKLPAQKANVLKLMFYGGTVGGAIGAAWSFFTNSSDEDDNNNQITEKRPPEVIEALPNVRISRQIVNPNDDRDLDIMLFQFQTCPFCCKVRNFLDFMGFSYKIVEVDAVFRGELKWSDYRKVPMVLAKQKDGQYVQLTDSSTIVSVLASYVLDEKEDDIGNLAKLYPTISYTDDHGKEVFDVMNKYFIMYQDKVSAKQTSDEIMDERKWRDWADNRLVHLISPNVYRSYGEAYETFEWFSEAGEWEQNFPEWQKQLMIHVGTMAMWLISKRLVARHHLYGDVRHYIYEALDEWTDELEKKKNKFMGGRRPNLADVSVFGILSSMEGCKAFRDCLENTKIGNWFYAMQDVINKNKGSVVKIAVEQEIDPKFVLK